MEIRANLLRDCVMYLLFSLFTFSTEARAHTYLFVPLGFFFLRVRHSFIYLFVFFLLSHV